MRVSGNAVAVGVAQQRDAVRARHAGAGALHAPSSMTHALDALAFLRAAPARWSPRPARRRSAARRASADARARRRTPRRSGPRPAVGFAPSLQPTALAMLTVGISVLFGSGSVGLVPCVCCFGQLRAVAARGEEERERKAAEALEVEESMGVVLHAPHALKRVRHGAPFRSALARRTACAAARRSAGASRSARRPFRRPSAAARGRPGR